MSDDLISYEGIDDAVLLHALYHGTRPIGWGQLHNKNDFSLDDARDALSLARLGVNGEIWFDYVMGRPIKICLDRGAKTIRRADLYDRDAGQGTCARIVAGLRGR